MIMTAANVIKRSKNKFLGAKWSYDALHDCKDEVLTFDVKSLAKNSDFQQQRQNRMDNLERIHDVCHFFLESIFFNVEQLFR